MNQPKSSHSSDSNPSATWRPATRAVRAGNLRSAEGEHSEAIFLTSSFVFENAEQAAGRFSGELPGNVYSRFTNPNTTSLSKRMASLEQANYGLVTASGMGAITTLFLGLLQTGDHVVCAKEIFGTSVALFRDVVTRFGIAVDFVNLTDYAAWEQKIQPNKTRFIFCETPSNPLVEVVDIERLATIAHNANCLLIVDNCLTTPVLQQPMLFGADIVIHSMTKFIDGGGRCLGGCLVMNDEQIYQQLFATIRSTGPALSPFNAWLLHKSLETLLPRMTAHSENAYQLANWLNEQPQIKKVYYPALEQTNQALIHKQMTTYGALLSFEMHGGKEAAWQLIDRCQLFSITANLGDARSSICHPATTTHNRVAPEVRQQIGVSDGLIRISVGLEDINDLCEDLRF